MDDASETRVRDLETAVNHIRTIVEAVVVSDRKRLGAKESTAYLKTLDHVRMLLEPEDNGDDPTPSAPAIAPVARYWLDLRNGQGYETDDLADVVAAISNGTALNVRDRSLAIWLLWQGEPDERLKHTFSSNLADSSIVAVVAAIGARRASKYAADVADEVV